MKSRQMKRIYTSSSIAVAATLLAAVPAFAAEPEKLTVAAPFGLDNLTFGVVLTFLINAAFVIAAVLALVFLIWGGINWITSGGDADGVKSARDRIIAAIIGLIVVILSYFLLNFVLSDILGVGSLTTGLEFCSLSASADGCVAGNETQPDTDGQ